MPVGATHRLHGRNAMKTVKEIALFLMGKIVITPGALEAIPAKDTLAAILRHSLGDWGDLCEEDWESNEIACERHSRLFSVYHTMDGTKFWIITEHDRSSTTILLPNEY